MPDTIAPYRADQVGSLLRSAPLKAARAARIRGEITAAELKAAEDEEIRRIVRKQEELGLKLATDGEFRRTWWQLDFFEGLNGVEAYQAERGFQFKGIETPARAIRVAGKVDFPDDHPMLEHFKFLAAHTEVTPKMTVPAPANLHFRNGRQAVSREIYPDLGPFFDDLATVYGKVIKAFYDAGCRYLQLDDTTWGYLCSAEERALANARGDDNVDELPAIYAEMTNTALKAKPADMVVTTHVCRGNFRSHWISEGGYEPVAELLLGGTNYDGYFMEWDTDRAGGLEPLRFLPKGRKRAVVGLVTSKTGELERKDDIKRRLDEAARYAPIDQLCLSPQCGFASTEEGNVLTEEQQWAKLRLVVEVAREVWGD
jgi:5-methyltetrahydropteroyltriglutamate--homocysteine methyltransferase